MKEYITKTEMEHCMQVKEIFRKLSEGGRDFCVVDAYPFGCEVLEWYGEGRGFDRIVHFTEASELFDYLLETWEKIYLFEMKERYGDTDMEDEEILKILPEERRKEMAALKEDYIMQYKKRSANWQ